jgi:hypothetical protein
LSAGDKAVKRCFSAVRDRERGGQPTIVTLQAKVTSSGLSGGTGSPDVDIKLE